MRRSSVLTLTLCAPLLLASSALGLKVWLLPPTLSGYNQLSTSVMYILRFINRTHCILTPASESEDHPVPGHRPAAMISDVRILT